MDYESLQKQRRRNWNAPKLQEVRRREKEAEREREREKKDTKKEGIHTRRARKEEEKAERNRQEYRRTVRQVSWLVGVFLLAIVVVLSAEKLLDMRRRGAMREQLERYNLTMRNGELIDNLQDPVGALATWRSAWMEGDMEKLIGLFSRDYYDKISGTRNRNSVINEYKQIYNRGAFESEVELAGFFDYPGMVRMPGRPWSDQELAIFRSPYIMRTGDEPPGTRFIAAFSYDSRSGEWRFADAREAQFFNVNWESEPAIREMRAGPNAIRYDEEGDPIE